MSSEFKQMRIFQFIALAFVIATCGVCAPLGPPLVVCESTSASLGPVAIRQQRLARPAAMCGSHALASFLGHCASAAPRATARWPLEAASPPATA